jgi:DNA polymerase sigma
MNTNNNIDFNVQTKIFGSCATGLALTSSDIDISVSGLEAYDRFALGDYLLLISNALNQFKWVTSNDPILTASVPVLKLVRNNPNYFLFNQNIGN